MPKVLNARQVGTAVEGAAYVGRPTKFGNPFIVGKHGVRGECVAMFERWIATQPTLVAAAKQELKGKDLICWCAPSKCHADVLLRIANEE